MIGACSNPERSGAIHVPSLCAPYTMTRVRVQQAVLFIGMPITSANRNSARPMPHSQIQVHVASTRAGKRMLCHWVTSMPPKNEPGPWGTTAEPADLFHIEFARPTVTVEMPFQPKKHSQ